MSSVIMSIYSQCVSHDIYCTSVKRAVFISLNCQIFFILFIVLKLLKRYMWMEDIDNFIAK